MLPVPPRTPCEAGAKEFVSLQNTPGATEPHGYFWAFPAFPLGVLFHQADPPVPRQCTAGAAPPAPTPALLHGALRGPAATRCPHTRPAAPQRGRRVPRAAQAVGAAAKGTPLLALSPSPHTRPPHRLAPKRASEPGCGWKVKK